MPTEVRVRYRCRCARAYYQIADQGNDGWDFETRILVKSNPIDMLRRELCRRSRNRGTVTIETSTDANQPAEGRFRLTRQALEAFRDFRTPVGLVTTSPLVIRDLLLAANYKGGSSRLTVMHLLAVEEQLPLGEKGSQTTRASGTLRVEHRGGWCST